MPDVVEFQLRGRVGMAVANNPPVNALSHGVRVALAETLDRFERDADLDALVLCCRGKNFFAGADIQELNAPMADPQLGDLIERIEAAAKPIVAAIHGHALGGGLELALGCHYRVATPTATIGLPEVTLGCIPGCGATQRLPRLIGLQAALTMITQGEQVAAPKARDMGVIDALIDDDLADGAVAFAERHVAQGRPLPRVGDLPPPPDDAQVFAKMRQTVAKKYPGQNAPVAAIEAIRLSYAYPLATALAEEHALSRRLLDSPQSRALRHLFAAQRAVAHVPGVTDKLPARAIRKVAVIGLGTMGMGIVQTFANAGLPVVAIARTQDKLDAAIARIGRAYHDRVARGRLGQAQADARIGCIQPALDYAAIADVDLVVEATTEDMDIKKTVFAALVTATRPGTILASNTSYLDIDELAAASGRAEDVCGMHFFNPAPAIRLLEHVRGQKTAPDVVATVMALAKHLGKVAIVARVCEGFVVNRMLAKRSREGFFLLEEGATPGQIDRVLTEFGFPMGPYALADLAGIDVQYSARQARLAGMSAREQAADFIDQLYAQGRYGQKSGAGWYRYADDRTPRHDPAIDAMLAAHAQARGLTQRQISDTEVLERCLYAMVNEGAQLIADGIVAGPREIDVAMVRGLGFPAVTGGPMWWADTIGLDTVRDAMQRYVRLVGPEYWTPAAPVEARVRQGQGFYRG